jgi:F0F1-type ATP synthase membrane subunit c/vacuolar-type H+-ATPase subunit K
MSASKKTAVAGAAFLVFWGALATYTALLPPKARSQLAYDPVFFPALLIGLGILLSLVIIGQGLHAGRQARGVARKEEAGHDLRRVLALVIVVGLYFAAMPVLGFIISSTLLIPIFTTVLGYRRWPVVAGLAVFGPIVVWFLFTYGLKAPLPAFMGG